jgi:hypothetical protein
LDDLLPNLTLEDCGMMGRRSFSPPAARRSVRLQCERNLGCSAPTPQTVGHTLCRAPSSVVRMGSEPFRKVGWMMVRFLANTPKVIPFKGNHTGLRVHIGSNRRWNPHQGKHKATTEGCGYNASTLAWSSLFIVADKSERPFAPT